MIVSISGNVSGERESPDQVESPILKTQFDTSLMIVRFDSLLSERNKSLPRSECCSLENHSDFSPMVRLKISSLLDEHQRMWDWK